MKTGIILSRDDLGQLHAGRALPIVVQAGEDKIGLVLIAERDRRIDLGPEYPCGHPRTGENSYRTTRGSFQCRTCTLTGSKRRQRELRATAKTAIPSSALWDGEQITKRFRVTISGVRNAARLGRLKIAKRAPRGGPGGNKMFFRADDVIAWAKRARVPIQER